MAEAQIEFAPSGWEQPSSVHGAHLLARSSVALVGIVALAMSLRFLLLGRNSVFFDEAYVVWLTRYSWQDIPLLMSAHEFHPPLHFLLMKAWVAIAGQGEAAIRTPSAIFSGLSVCLTYFLVRRVRPESLSLLAAFLVAIAPFDIMAAQDAKMYPLVEALTLAATILLASAVERGGALRWAGYAALATLLLYTHYLGLFVIAAHGAWVLLWERSRFQAWLGALVFVLACYLPWIPYFWEQIGFARDFIGWGEDNFVDQILALLTFFAFGGSLFAAPGFLNAATRLSRVEILALLLPSIVVVSAGIASFRRDRRALAFIGLPPLVVIGAPLLLSIAKPLFAPRWFSFLVPFYMAFVASGVSTIARSLRTRTLSIGAAVLIIAGLALYDVQVLRHYYFDPGLRDRWRDAAALVGKHRQPTDLLLYANFQAKIIFTYYLGDIHPSMLVVVGGDGRVEGAVPVGDQFPTVEQLVPFRNLAAPYRRVWLIVAPGGAFRSAQQQDEVFAHLLPTYVLEGFSGFPRSRWRAAPVYPYVYLFRAK